MSIRTEQESPSEFRAPTPSARLLLGLATLVVLSGCDAADAGDAVFFGLAGPFDRAYGEEMARGAELARDEINAAGGIDGRPLEFVVRSDDADPQVAIDVSLDLAQDDRVVAVVGHVNSGAMVAAAAQYNEAGLPAVGTQTTAPVIGAEGPYIFRVASSDSSNAVVLARYSYRMSDGRVGLLYDNNAYGRGLYASFLTAFEDLGGELLNPSPYLERTTHTFDPYLHRYDRQNASIVFIAGTEQGSADIIRRTNELGYDFTFVGGDGLEGLKGRGAEFEGNIAGLMYHPEASEAAARFAETYRSRYGGTPDSFSALAYDAVHLLARAAGEAGARRDAIRDYLAGVGRPDGRPPFEGVAGTIQFDEHGDPADKPFYVGVLRQGRIELLPNLN